MELSHQDYDFAHLTARYLFDAETGAVALVLLPRKAATDAYAQRRAMLGVPELVKIGMDASAWHVGSLVHLALRHHAQGNGAGNTLKYGASTSALHFVAQRQEANGAVVTELAAQEGYGVVHTLRPCRDAAAVEISTVFCNETGRDMTLDMVTSFSLDNLSPYDTADAQALRLHRFRGGWSMEGTHVSDSIEDLNLACPWTYSFPESERFGVLGSHPVKRFFPVCAVEDARAGIFWGAALSVAASWQLELSRDSDCYSLSGGIADCEFGGWHRTVKHGERFTAPCAYISASFTLDDVCDNLTSVYHAYADAQPKSEHDLPVLFNEWCTTWGNPSHDRMLELADSLAGTPVNYLVIDAGWTDVLPNSFGQGGNGDWNYARDRFPGGLRATSRALKKKGFVTGVWFEFEVTTKGARVYEHDYDAMHLTRGGEPVVTGADRSFWDFRNPLVIGYLREKVLDFLRDNEIGYLKVDYNGSIGAGCDGAESPSSALHDHIDAVLEFFSALRTELPQLVIENCASGGHRLVAPFLQRTAMSSFSDAHEGKEIPVIAARLHRIVLPRQLQVWAVLNPEHSVQELHYRLVSGFLGRLCLSGAVDKLVPAQRDIVRRALALYERCAGVIKYGSTRMQGCGQPNLHHLSGWQAAVRQSADGTQVLVVVHLFRNAPTTLPCIALPNGMWQLCENDTLCDAFTCRVDADGLHLAGGVNFSAAALLLTKAAL